jgi:Fe-S cluster assembly iron-binding protein IscA
MLTLTETASTLIRNLADQSVDAEDPGLRISADAEVTTLTADLAPAPEPTDAVIVSDGARVFLEENAAEALADKVLDAQLEEDGTVRFAIAEV